MNMVYDGRRHESIARHPELAQRNYIISSFGKTYHVTGWKVGYVVAPAALMAEFRKVHQFNVFTVNTPMQVGLAQYMQNPAPYLGCPRFINVSATSSAMVCNILASACCRARVRIFKVWITARFQIYRNSILRAG
jgi:aspartate/methionine/tyrosine aminotransferase